MRMRGIVLNWVSLHNTIDQISALFSVTCIKCNNIRLITSLRNNMYMGRTAVAKHFYCWVSTKPREAFTVCKARHFIWCCESRRDRCLLLPVTCLPPSQKEAGNGVARHRPADPSACFQTIVLHRSQPVYVLRWSDLNRPDHPYAHESRHKFGRGDQEQANHNSVHVH